MPILLAIVVKTVRWIVDNSVTNPVDKPVDNHVHKLVDKRVDNAEDNPVEQLKNDAKTKDWAAIYARYITQNRYQKSGKNGNQISAQNNPQNDVQNINPRDVWTAEQQQYAADLIQALLHATENGDSLIKCNAHVMDELTPWVIEASQAQSHILRPDQVPVAPCVYSNGTLALYRYWQLEQRLSQQVQRLSQQTVVQVDATLAYSLLKDEHQRAALDLVCHQAFSLITGGPGTGKTYTLARIIALLQHRLPEARIAMAAPTGKAAQRMQEALQQALTEPELQVTGWVSAQLQQQRTQTLHRLLGIGINQHPRFHTKQPLPFDVIVVDEASMLDLSLATALFEAIPEHARLILLGDAQQLASVDVGAVLADLQAASVLQAHRVHLHTSRRFVAHAQIGRCAQFIHSLSNNPPFTANAGLAEQQLQQLVDSFYQQVSAPIPAVAMRDIAANELDRVQLALLPQLNEDDLVIVNILLAGFQSYVAALQHYQQQPTTAHLHAVVSAFDDYRILCAVKHGRWGLQQLNRLASIWLQQQLAVTMGEFYLGRPVMMIYNDYQLGLSNGDIGICLPKRADASSNTALSADAFEVYFPSLQQWFTAQRLPKNVQDAFVLTIHKSQGSEFRHCAVVLANDAEKVLSRELLYTAITRAKQVVSLWLHPQALAKALAQDSSRCSGLLMKIESSIQGST